MCGERASQRKYYFKPNFTFQQFKSHQTQFISLKCPHLFQLRAFGHRPLPLYVSERNEVFKKYVGFVSRKPKQNINVGFRIPKPIYF